MRTRVGFAVLLAVILAAGVAVRAQLPFTLSGTVFGGATVLSGAVVEALQDGTSTVVGSSTTNAQGRYSLSLPAATYDLRVTPPTGSGFGQRRFRTSCLPPTSSRTSCWSREQERRSQGRCAGTEPRP